MAGRGRRTRSRGNLPADVTSFVGRRPEIAEVKRLLNAARLVTVTGVAGVGKTRVALRVAGEVTRQFADGVWLVSLSPLECPELIAGAIAEVLGLRDQTGRPMDESLAEFVADKRLLLVLDTCERLVDGCADVAEGLLRAAPQLRILATSREPLHAAGEHVFVVPPLPVEAPGRLVDDAPSEASELFRVRAEAILPGFALTDEGLPAVARLCRRLDGLPLAIELAAVQLRALSVDQITARLDQRFEVLATNRAAEPRHQTLRTAIDWSYDLCEPAERRLWARLTVFAGAFDLVSAEAVCADGTVAAGDLARYLGSLVEKSLLVRVVGPEPPLFQMLDTIREYGAERLRELGEDRTLRRRHRVHYLDLVRRAEAAWSGPDQLGWFDRMAREHGNLRAALDDFLHDPGGGSGAQELAARLWFVWIAGGRLREGRDYLEQALASNKAAEPDSERRRALWACAFVAGTQGDTTTADLLAGECLTDAIAVGDARLAAYATETLGMVATLRGDHDVAVADLSVALVYYRNLDDTDPGLLRALTHLGLARIMRGDVDTALELAQECAALCRERGERWQRSYVDYLSALALRAKGERGQAALHVRDAIAVKLHFNDVVGLVMCVEFLAGLAADGDDSQRAARLLGAAQRLRDTFGVASFQSPFHTADHRSTKARAVGLLGDGPYREAFDAGRHLRVDEAIRYALGRREAVPVPFNGGTDPLTPREAQVAELVAAGLSNREIAERLVIAKRTADSHVEHILVKLGYTTRAQIAAWITAQRRGPG